MIRFTLFITLIVCVSASPASAKMVKYVDENGNPHYVDTDYATVPERYRYQVEPQLKEEGEETEETVSGTHFEAPPASQKPIIPQNRQITLFYTESCQTCLVLGAFLTKEGIVFTSVNIETPDGMIAYQAAGSPALPSAKVGNTVVTGADAGRIMALAQGKEDPKPKEKPKPNSSFKAPNFRNPYPERQLSAPSQGGTSANPFQDKNSPNPFQH